MASLRDIHPIRLKISPREHELKPLSQKHITIMPSVRWTRTNCQYKIQNYIALGVCTQKNDFEMMLRVKGCGEGVRVKVRATRWEDVYDYYTYITTTRRFGKTRSTLGPGRRASFARSRRCPRHSFLMSGRKITTTGWAAGTYAQRRSVLVVEFTFHVRDAGRKKYVF